MTRIDTIRARLPTLSDSDGESINREIKRRLEQNWTDDEIVAFCRLTEECNPTLNEEIAVGRMMKIIDSAKIRLSQKTAGG